MRTNTGDYPVFKLRTGPHAGADLEELSIDGADMKGQRIRNINISADATEPVRVTIEHLAVIADVEVRAGEFQRVLQLVFQEERTLPVGDIGAEGESAVHMVSSVIAEEVGDSLSDALRRMADRVEIREFDAKTQRG